MNDLARLFADDPLNLTKFPRDIGDMSREEIIAAVALSPEINAMVEEYRSARAMFQASGGKAPKAEKKVKQEAIDLDALGDL